MRQWSNRRMDPEQEAPGGRGLSARLSAESRGVGPRRGTAPPPISTLPDPRKDPAGSSGCPQPRGYTTPRILIC